MIWDREEKRRYGDSGCGEERRDREIVDVGWRGGDRKIVDVG